MLLFASCCSTWPMLRPYDTSLFGSTRTWYSRVVPPKLLTSTTSGTDLNCFSSVQSSMDFSVHQVDIRIRASQRVPINLAHGTIVRTRSAAASPAGRVDLGEPLEHLLPIPVVLGLIVEDQLRLERPKIDTERR